jgi:hypothetical protein
MQCEALLQVHRRRELRDRGVVSRLRGGVVTDTRRVRPEQATSAGHRPASGTRSISAMIAASAARAATAVSPRRTVAIP